MPQPDPVTTPAARPVSARHAHSPAPRRSPADVPSIKGIRISPPGFKATLVDISESGLLAEWGVALKIGQAVTVNFEGTFTPQAVQGHVVRSSVASMTSAGVRYNVGLAFATPIVLDNHPPESNAENSPLPIEGDPSMSDVVNRW
jgi:hypothetical protein